MIHAAALHASLDDGALSIAPLAEAHREGLRAACAADPAIWDIYPVSMLGDAFDPAFDAMRGTPNRLAFAILDGRAVAGCASFWPDAANAVVEIGGTYLAPAWRGGSFNRRIKTLMLDRAFGLGVRRVEFRVDTRNMRSCRAVEKLGAKLDGVLRRNRVTWTGYVRDTAVYSLIAGEWR